MSFRVPNSVWYRFPGPLAPEIAIIKFLDDHVHCDPRDYNTLHNLLISITIFLSLDTIS